MMVFLFVKWAYVCIMMVYKKQNIAKNTAALLQTGRKAAFANTLAQTLSTEEQYIFNKKIIQDYLTYRHETVRNGNWNTTVEHLLKDQINVKK